jgi:uncharacterized membrane protein
MVSSGPRSHELSWWRNLWRPFWALPTVLAVCSTLMGLFLPSADRQLADWVPYTFEGGANGARSLLSTIATAMISVTGLVFSITIVVLQLASSQFSPRLLGTFLERRVVQVTLGVFAGSFLYALTVLRSVRDSGGDTFVPQLSVSLAYAYVLASVFLFLAFIHQITTAVQVSETVSRLGEQTRAAIHRMVSDESRDGADRPACPRTAPEGGGGRSLPVLLDERHGHLVAIDVDGVARWCEEHGALVELDVALGDFCVPGTRVGLVLLGNGAAPHDADIDVGPIARCLHLESQRTTDTDFDFGVRQLIDIAQRALSPGVNDPTTALEVVDELHVIFRVLATTPAPTPWLFSADGRVVGRYRSQALPSELVAAIRDIGHYGKTSTRVLPRLEAMLDDLAGAARSEYTPAIEAARAELHRLRNGIG